MGWRRSSVHSSAPSILTPGFESQAHHLRFKLWHVEKTEINRKRRRDWPVFLKKQMWKMSVYVVLGFESTTLQTWASSHNHLTRAPSPKRYFYKTLFFANFAKTKVTANSNRRYDEFSALKYRVLNTNAKYFGAVRNSSRNWSYTIIRTDTDMQWGYIYGIYRDINVYIGTGNIKAMYLFPEVSWPQFCPLLGKVKKNSLCRQSVLWPCSSRLPWKCFSSNWPGISPHNCERPALYAA